MKPHEGQSLDLQVRGNLWIIGQIEPIYQLKNGKTLSYIDYSTEMMGKNVTIKSENLLKKKMDRKDAIEILNKLRDSNSFTKNSILNIEYAKSECYDEEGNLLFTMQIKDSKVITESQKTINENIIKMIYIVNDIDTDSGLMETYINGKLGAIMRMKNSLPNGEAKIFYPSGKLLSIFPFLYKTFFITFPFSSYSMASPFRTLSLKL